MHILFLCKRHPQQRDLLDRPYGRYFHLPAGLAARGHEVTVALLSHRRLASEERRHADVHWLADDLLPDPTRYWRRLKAVVQSSRPDWIVAGSDLHFGILAARLGRQSGIPVAIDAYDNFDSYIPWAKPLHALWHRALGNATAVMAGGPQLLAHLQRHAAQARAAVVPMAADPAFAPRPKAQARRQLGLSASARLIGYCGSLFPGRGAETLLQAFELLARRHADLELVATGRVRLTLPAHVKHLGYLPDAEIPAFLSAIDVACVTAVPDGFGNFAYPGKLYEAMACHTAVVATDVAPIRWILAGDERLLAPPDDPAQLAARLEQQLLAPQRAPAPAGWDTSVSALETALASAP